MPSAELNCSVDKQDIIVMIKWWVLGPWLTNIHVEKFYRILKMFLVL